MQTNDYDLYSDYLSNNVITPFYEWRIAKLESLTLNQILRRKNPYLFKAKNIHLAGDLIKGVVDAFMSSGEETVFGDYLESFAIFVSKHLHNGSKSDLKSVDLEFSRDGVHYLVGIKSGINWGNNDQINKMKENFRLGRIIRKHAGISVPIVAVNGCIYGKDGSPLKNSDADSDKHYYKYAGQDFWRFISGDDELYREIIKPIDEKAKDRDNTFQNNYAAKINNLTAEFIERFTENGQINWIQLVDFVSKRANG